MSLRSLFTASRSSKPHDHDIHNTKLAFNHLNAYHRSSSVTDGIATASWCNTLFLPFDGVTPLQSSQYSSLLARRVGLLVMEQLILVSLSRFTDVSLFSSRIIVAVDLCRLLVAFLIFSQPFEFCISAFHILFLSFFRIGKAYLPSSSCTQASRSLYISSHDSPRYMYIRHCITICGVRSPNSIPAFRPTAFSKCTRICVTR